jgi:hypothetical protein
MTNPAVKKRDSDDDRRYMADNTVENLVQIVLEMGAQIWINRDRMAVIEKLLAEKGVVTLEMIENYQHSPAEQAERAKARDAFAAQLFGAFARNPG